VDERSLARIGDASCVGGVCCRVVPRVAEADALSVPLALLPRGPRLVDAMADEPSTALMISRHVR
jgi:hypothetical protein